MSCLHIINRILSHSQCEIVFSSMSEGDAILLIEDGCYLPKRTFHESLEHSLYLLKTDALIRGLTFSDNSIILVDDNGFVALTAEHTKSITWTFS